MRFCSEEWKRVPKAEEVKWVRLAQRVRDGATSPPTGIGKATKRRRWKSWSGGDEGPEIPVVTNVVCWHPKVKTIGTREEKVIKEQRAKHIEKETALCLTQTVPSNQHCFYYRKLLTPSATHHPSPIPNLPCLGTLSWHTHITSR